MEIASIPTEQTTAGTDALLALAGVASACATWQYRAADPWKAGIWTAMFVLMALAAVLGTVAHGLELSPFAHALVWRALNAALGFAVGLFALGSIYAMWGEWIAARALPVTIGLGCLFFAVTCVAPDKFLLFVLYESSAMAFALGVYFLRLLWWRSAGDAWMLTGVVLTLIAAGCQAAHLGSFRLIWPFDHNGLFHLIQIAAVACLAIGLNVSVPSKDKRTP